MDIPNWRVVDECVQNNTILKLSASSAELNKFLVVLRFCMVRIDASPAYRQKACILAPNVPLVKKYFDAARQMNGLRAQSIIGTSAVDAWDREDWRTVIEGNEVLMITPQLFLDALNSEHLRLNEFCALAFDECQNCIGRDIHSNPYAKILSSYYTFHNLRWETIRVLGLCTQPHKNNAKTHGARLHAVVQLQQALRARVRRAEDLMMGLHAEPYAPPDV